MKDYEKIRMEIYRELYKNAEPASDFDELIKSSITANPEWFMRYYLDQAEQERILKEICEKYKLSKHETNSLSINICLGCSPNCSKSRWEEIIKNDGRQP